MRDYSKFSHLSHLPPRRKLACASCHEIPTPGSVRLRGYLDITDYPDHDSCIQCHRQQFFSGARPLICTICHTRVSPRDDARFPFPKGGGARQFAIEFPHDKHQDVIALNQPRREADTETQLLRIMHASFVFAGGRATDGQATQYKNCSICHETTKREPQPPRRGVWPDAFVPTAASFKTVPRSHASCFDCHWKNQQPTSDNCAGCHQLTTPYVASDWPRRISVKFNHEGGGDGKEHIAECTTCHVNITRVNEMQGLKPPIWPTCSASSCHYAKLQEEVVKFLDKKQFPNFKCDKCHTSDIAGQRPSDAHFFAVGQPVPTP